MGSDPAVEMFPPPKRRISIHAPAWGATGETVETLPPSQISIHAPAWGATPLSLGEMFPEAFLQGISI